MKTITVNGCDSCPFLHPFGGSNRCIMSERHFPSRYREIAWQITPVNHHLQYKHVVHKECPLRDVNNTSIPIGRITLDIRLDEEMFEENLRK